MKNLKRPSRFSLGAHTVPIEWVRDLPETLGMFSSNPPRIKICLGQDRVGEVDTLVHEIMHAIWHVRGLQDSDGEERVVSVLSSGWVEVLARNADLRRYLTGGW